MAKDKMNTPQIRFKEFEGEWNNRIIDSVIQLRSEVGNQEDFTVDIELENLVSNLGIIVGDTTVRTQATSLFRSGDILFGRLRPYLNKWWLANTDGVKSGEIWALYPKNEGSNRFIYSLIQTEKFLTYVNLTSGTKMPRADWSVIKNHSIDIPKLNEQTQIGDFFQKIDQVIELQQKALDTARAYKQSMLQKMFPQKGEKVPRVRFAGFSGDWDKYYLADIVHQVRSYSLSRGVETEDYTGVKYIHYGDIHLGKARYLQTDEELSFINFDIDCTVLQQGDLVVADASEDYLGIAEPCVINFEPQTKLVAGLHTIAIRPDQSQNSIFLFYYFKTKQFKKHCYRVGTGMKVFGITFNNLSKYEGYFPNKEEQTAIGNFFQKLDQKIEQQAQKLATYQQLKKAMLQRMFV